MLSLIVFNHIFIDRHTRARTHTQGHTNVSRTNAHEPLIRRCMSPTHLPVGQQSTGSSLFSRPPITRRTPGPNLPPSDPSYSSSDREHPSLVGHRHRRPSCDIFTYSKRIVSVGKNFSKLIRTTGKGLYNYGTNLSKQCLSYIFF